MVAEHSITVRRSREGSLSQALLTHSQYSEQHFALVGIDHRNLKVHRICKGCVASRVGIPAVHRILCCLSAVRQCDTAAFMEPATSLLTR
jgi:hypothetical protein